MLFSKENEWEKKRVERPVLLKYTDAWKMSYANRIHGIQSISKWASEHIKKQESDEESGGKVALVKKTNWFWLTSSPAQMQYNS